MRAQNIICLEGRLRIDLKNSSLTTKLNKDHVGKISEVVLKGINLAGEERHSQCHLGQLPGLVST